MSLTSYSPGQVLTAASLNDNYAYVEQNGINYKNVVINGAMQVAQRGTSTASITTTGYYTADRWELANITCGTHTMSVENDAPTGSGFRKSLKLLVTTADAAPAAGDALICTQKFEGQNVQQFLKGTASAKSFTLTFWVKSNVTGTYVVGLLDSDNTRNVGATYTVNASGTWEKKTITIPADTTGAFDNDNASSLSMSFWLDSGSNFDSGTLNTTWASTVNANRNAGGASLAAATNNYWQITGVQLEAGSVATPFEFEDYGTTLAKCQRYYCKTFPLATAPANGLSQAGSLLAPIASGTGATAYAISWSFPVPMRASPTVTTFTPSSGLGTGEWFDSAGALVAAGVSNTSADRASIYNTGAAVTGRNAVIHATASAEL